MKTFQSTKFNLFPSLSAACAAALMIVTAQAETNTVNASELTKTSSDQVRVAPALRPRIQIAVLLDTSSSMDGLINQTRTQLWQMVNELAKANQQGVTPQLEVAVYEYGNTGLARSNGFVRQVVALTPDLDKVSEALFSLTTNGGDEFCGFVIASAVRELQWSSSKDDLRLIFIAGNEPFTQGPVPFSEAMSDARKRDIAVSTIFAGQYNEGVATGWQKGALLAEGNYMSIDHDQQLVHMVAPQDQRIAELNSQLNQTYIPYGSQGKAASERQQVQDQKSNQASPAVLAQRAKAKVSAAYSNTEWDLVDAVEAGTVNIEAIDKDDLPASMAVMSAAEKQHFVAEKQQQRQSLKAEIKRLSEARDSYVAAAEAEAPAVSAKPTMADALTESVREQAGKKAFDF